MNAPDLQLSSSREITTQLDEFSTGLTAYLSVLRLPAEAVLVEVDERRDVINIMPRAIATLNESQRQAAMYISKFVAASVAGLFDAALNYLWNETIRNLRDKVARFDLNYFYDSVITDASRRKHLKDESDLEKLEDWELVKGCRETGIITMIGFRHLDYIRDMRNHTSAAHPNQNELSGLQLASWLQTCIREVLSKDPEGSAIEARRLLRSLREEVLQPTDVPPIAAATAKLPEEIARALLRSIFGMYTDPGLDADTRNNIGLVAPHIWLVCSNEARYETGLRQGTYRANGEVTRTKFGRDFLELVGGLTYLPSDVLAIEIGISLDNLLTAHEGWNNFYNEEPHARTLYKLIPDSGNIPTSIEAKYVRVLTMCRIGNGHGVSWAGKTIYDELIQRWRDRQIARFTLLPRDADVASRLQLQNCTANYRAQVTELLERAVNMHLKRMLEFLVQFPRDTMDMVAKDSRYQALATALLETARQGGLS